MSALAVASVCATCGSEFEQTGLGRPRRHCEACRAPRTLDGAKAKLKLAPEVTPGEPFTVEHFRVWALRLLLDNGEPWRLEPFQEAFVADLFSGVREAWLIVPEGNGKTTLVAGLALYHIEHTSEAWVTVAAASREQAGTLYMQAAGLVLRNPVLSGAFTALPGYRRIHCPARRSSIQVFAADANTGDGVIPTFAIVDELHRHRSLDLYRTWAGKLWKRGAQIVVISTAGEPGSDFETTRERFRQTAVETERDVAFVRARSSNSVLHEWAVPENADVEDLELVAAANPFSGVTAETLAEKRRSPSWTLGHWRRFVCNLPTRSVFAAIEEAEWEKAARDEALIVRGETVWLGVDVAWKWDTTALVPFWPVGSDDRRLGVATILEPPRDGTSLDPHLVEMAFAACYQRNPFDTVVMDTTRAEQLASWVSETFGCTVIDYPQATPAQARDYERFMGALRTGWLTHSGDPGLTRHALNAVAKLLPGGGAKFERPMQSRRVASGEQDRRVIDALIAAAMVNSAYEDTLSVEVAAAPRVIDLELV